MKATHANATLLSHLQSDAPLSLTVDASDTDVGAVLHQYVSVRVEPLEFFCRSLQPRDTRYSAFSRELLVACFLEGRNFSLYTDHNPLVAAPMNAIPRESNGT